MVKILLFYGLVLMNKLSVEFFRLPQIIHELLYFECGENDEISHTGNLEGRVFHSHTLAIQREPVDRAFEVWCNQESHYEHHVLLDDSQRLDISK